MFRKEKKITKNRKNKDDCNSRRLWIIDMYWTDLKAILDTFYRK